MEARVYVVEPKEPSGAERSRTELPQCHIWRLRLRNAGISRTKNSNTHSKGKARERERDRECVFCTTTNKHMQMHMHMQHVFFCLFSPLSLHLARYSHGHASRGFYLAESTRVLGSGSYPDRGSVPP